MSGSSPQPTRYITIHFLSKLPISVTWIKLDADPDPVCHFCADPDTPRHFDANANPTFYRDVDPDHNFFQFKDHNLENVTKQAHVLYIFACHLQIDADFDPVHHFAAYPTFQFDGDPDPQHCFLYIQQYFGYRFI
jgi:hypothetical protein